MRINHILKFIKKPSDVSTEDERSKERYRRITISAILSLANKGVTVVTTLISVPLTVNYLGAERYGLWMTISSAVAMLGFADLGMGNGLLNLISEANGKDDRHLARVYVSSAFFMLLGVSLLILILFSSIYFFIPWSNIFNVQSSLAIRETAPAVAVLVSSFAINMPLGIVQRVQSGYQEDYKNQYWASLGSLFGLVGILVCVYFQAGLPWLILVLSGSTIFTTFLNGIKLFYFQRKWLFPSFKFFNWTAGKKITRLGSVFLVLQLLNFIGLSSDNLVISNVLGASSVATYAITQKLFFTAFVSQFFITPLWPAFGEAMARSDYYWAKKTLDKVLILSFGIGFFTSVLLFTYGKSIIETWTNPSLVPSTSLLLGFCAWLSLWGYVGTMSTFLNSGTFLKKQITFFSLATFTSLLLKVLLIHRYGISGVIWATVIGYGVFYVFPAGKLAYTSISQSIEVNQ